MKTKQHPTVLLIENDTSVVDWYKDYLKNEPMKLVQVHIEAALMYLQQVIPQAVLLNLELPNRHGMNILKHIHQQQLGCAVIVITTDKAVDLIVEVRRYGTFDVIQKPFKIHQLIFTLHQALSKSSEIPSTETGQKKVKPYSQFIGTSPAMQRVYQKIAQVANSKASILITGETGTGKELCAQALHQASQRQNKPFFALNCAAIPDNLIESELFGHVKGAFTGAIQNRQGMASLANGGTLFLDEIGEMDLNLQCKLLRFVETGTFYKLGSSQLETVDIRFIWATNRQLHSEIKAGRFRQDLYYRLKVSSILLPPLRERGQDILRLAISFLKQYTQLEQKSFKGFSLEAEKILLNYDWPGNVRQLQNVIHNLVLSHYGETITADMVQCTLAEEIEPPCDIMPSQSQDSPLPTAEVAKTSPKTIHPLWQVEKNAILEAIEFCNGSVVQAAKLLGIGKTTLYRKLQQWKPIKSSL
ncbi:MAG TPA: sigma-54-dependent Fis family transcriptional regulator [Thiotrichaceae bacterium]|nr:sigma-54-dependent Fis family transcriptional regulator [Thiotrichaceae bacterium]